jgi:hypothetical protein
MRWVSPTGSNFQSDGVTANDCATVTAPCADLATALFNLAVGERVGVFEGIYEHTSDFILTRAAKIDGGYYWETEGSVLAANSTTHTSTLEFTGASFVVKAPGEIVTINGLGFVGDHHPAVLHIVNSSPVFLSCRIRARSGVTLGHAVLIRSAGTIAGTARSAFFDSQITVGDVTADSASNSEATAIHVVNTSSAATLALTLRNSSVTVGSVKADASTGRTATSKGISIEGSTTGGITNLTLIRNTLILGRSGTSLVIDGRGLSAATIGSNSLIVRDGMKSSIGIKLTSTGSATDAVSVTGNLISLNKGTVRTQGNNFGISVNNFDTTIGGNSFVQGAADISIGVVINNSTSLLPVQLTHNFFQNKATATTGVGTMFNLIGIPTSLDISYNAFQFMTVPLTFYVFDGDDVAYDFQTAVAMVGDGSTTGLFTPSTYTGLTVTGNLDVASTDASIDWVGTPSRLMLPTDSVLIDKGDSSISMPAAARDLNDRPRVVNGIIDIGAVEARP